MAAIYTISPKVKKKNPMFCPFGVLMFLCISEQTVIMSVHNIN
jgi:hypothetical protein